MGSVSAEQPGTIGTREVAVGHVTVKNCRFIGRRPPWYRRAWIAPRVWLLRKLAGKSLIILNADIAFPNWWTAISLDQDSHGSVIAGCHFSGVDVPVHKNQLLAGLR